MHRQICFESLSYLESHLAIDNIRFYPLYASKTTFLFLFAEFVAVAKQLFKMTLNETNLGSLSMKSHVAVDFATSPTINQQVRS